MRYLKLDKNYNCEGISHDRNIAPISYSSWVVATRLMTCVIDSELFGLRPISSPKLARSISRNDNSARISNKAELTERKSSKRGPSRLGSVSFSQKMSPRPWTLETPQSSRKLFRITKVENHFFREASWLRSVFWKYAARWCSTGGRIILTRSVSA